MKAPLTQKARGVMAMKLYAPWANLVPNFRLVQVPGDVETTGLGMFFPAPFGRFCPPAPEHGYIESRKVKSKEDLLEMLKQTKAVHENSEIMLMQYYSPASLKGSFLWTPSQVTYGVGNDGATAGKPGCLRMPLVPTALPQELLDAAGIPAGMSPYVEGLHTQENNVLLVQLRYGPEPPAVLDYVPKTVTVEKIVPATGDLIEFAKLVKGLAKGTVVDHFGGSLTSHYGVHCLTNGVPIMTTRKVEVGETLEAIEPQMPEHNPVEVAKWLVFASRDARSRLWKHSEMEAVCNASLFVVHNAAVMGYMPQIVGAALAGLMKLCVTACHGEARYAKGDPMHGKGREFVFRKALKATMPSIADLPVKLEEFEGMGPMGGGYGGQPWAKCVMVTMELVQALQRLVRNPSDESLAKALSQANVVVNEAHNGGWWLNKFTNQHVFDACSYGSPWAICYAAEGLKGFMASAELEKPSVVNRVVGFRKNAFLKVEVQTREPQLRGAKMTVHVQPVTGEAYVVGVRWGWKWKLPKQMAEKAATLETPMNWVYYGSVKTPVSEGVSLPISKEGAMGYFDDQLSYKPSSLPVVGLEVFDAAANPQYVGGKVLHPVFINGVVAPVGMCLKVVGLCTSCASILRVPGATLCPDCGGPKVTTDKTCDYCKQPAVAEVTDVGEMGPRCLKCLWDLFTKKELALRADNARPVVQPQPNFKLQMCDVPNCSNTFTAPGHSGECGCGGTANAKGPKVSFTLEKLKGLK